MALFHTEFGRDGPGLLYRDILRGTDTQIEAGIAVLRHIDADVLVLGGVDHDHDLLALTALARRLGGYPFLVQRAPNRGVPSGLDLNRNGRLGDADDNLGYGAFRGAGGLAVLSRLPVTVDQIEDQTALPWRALEGNIAPEGTYDVEPLSSTVHKRIPIEIAPGRQVNLVVWHGTPPVFDGDEDRNGRRNHDEARLAMALVEGADAPVIVAGFANLDPAEDEGRPAALRALLAHPRLWDRPPVSVGGRLAALSDGGVNATQKGDPARDTVDWPDENGRPGNLRTDLLVPDRAFRVLRSGVFWPESGDSLGGEVRDASRHRVVWMDLVPNGPGEGARGVGGPEVGQ